MATDIRGENTHGNAAFETLLKEIQDKMENICDVVDITSALLKDANTCEGIPVPPVLETQLKEAKKLEELFTVLKNHPTHLNCTSIEILKKMAVTVDSKELMNCIDEYKIKVSSMKLFNFKLPPYDEDFYCTIDVKVEVDHNDLTMKDFFELQSELAKILKVDKSALLVTEISTGSIFTRFIAGLRAIRNAPWGRIAAVILNRIEITIRYTRDTDGSRQWDVVAGFTGGRTEGGGQQASIPLCTLQ